MDEQWVVSNAECNKCEHTWVAVHPLNSASLECPNCGSFDTLRFDPVNTTPPSGNTPQMAYVN